MARVTLSGELAEQVDLRAAVVDGIESDLDQVIYEFEDLYVAYDLDALAEEQTVRGEFVRAVRESGLPADEARRVVTAGLRAFDGRKDLEVGL